MRVKLYTASGMPEAIARIREELGAEAVILSSRKVAGGVQVTAALEAGDLPPPMPPRLAVKAGSAPGCLLRAHGTPEPLAGKLRAGPLAFALSVVLRFRALDAASLRRPLLFVGPPGAGKTLTVARMATRLVLQGGRPGVMTADARRAGAFEQLAAYTGLLGLTLRRFGETAPAHSASHGAPLLVDSAGLDPFDAADREELQGLLRSLDALCVLVLPAGLDAEEAAELAQGFAACGAERLVATRLDVARRLGGVLAAAQALPLAEAGVGASAAEGLKPMTPELLAACLHRRAPAAKPWSSS